MSKIILVMGLPGSGKTTLSSKISPMLDATWLNADQIRKEANDWDFSKEGRIRQSIRMRDKAAILKKKGETVVADFICPTKEARKLFGADFVIWMNTIKEGRFSDTNKLFENPLKEEIDFIVGEKNADFYAPRAVNLFYKKFNLLNLDN